MSVYCLNDYITCDPLGNRIAGLWSNSSILDGQRVLWISAPRINVIEKGSLNSTIINVDGKFKIEVGIDPILEFSYIGYLREEVAIFNLTMINLELLEFFPRATGKMTATECTRDLIGTAQRQKL